MSMSRNALALAAVILVLNGCGGGGGGDSPRTYAIGASVTGLVGSRLALSNNGVPVSIAPGLNERMTGLFSGLQNGTSYDVTVATQPTTPSQSCVVTNGKGTIAGADVDISVTCTTTPARFLLAQRKFSLPVTELCIKASAIDNTSGTLTAASGAPFCGEIRDQGTWGYPVGSMVAHPQGKSLYMRVASFRFGLLSQFTIDRDNGTVSLIQSHSLIRDGIVAIHPSGQFLFVTSPGFDGVGGFVATDMVDSATGALTPSASSSFNEIEPVDLSADPLGRFVYVLYSEPFSAPSSQRRLITALAVDSKTGGLSQVGQPVALDGARWLVTHPSGRFVYTAAGGNIVAFNVNLANGALTPISGPPFVAEAYGSAAIDPAGNYMYVLGSGSIFAYGIDRAGGQLAPINGSPFATGPNPSSVVIEPQGRFIYVSNDLGVSAYERDSSNGALTPISGSPFALAFGGNIAFSY